MNDLVKAIGFVLLILGFIALAIWLAVEDWTECRNVGHTWFYCFRHMGH